MMESPRPAPSTYGDPQSPGDGAGCASEKPRQRKQIQKFHVERKARTERDRDIDCSAEAWRRVCHNPECGRGCTPQCQAACGGPLEALGLAPHIKRIADETSHTAAEVAGVAGDAAVDARTQAMFAARSAGIVAERAVASISSAAEEAARATERITDPILGKAQQAHFRTQRAAAIVGRNAQKGAKAVDRAARGAGFQVYEASKDVPGTVQKGAETVKNGVVYAAVTTAGAAQEAAAAVNVVAVNVVDKAAVTLKEVNDSTADAAADARFEAVLAQRRAVAATAIVGSKVADAAGVVGNHINNAGAAMGLDLAGTAGAVAGTAGQASVAVMGDAVTDAAVKTHWTTTQAEIAGKVTVQKVNELGVTIKESTEHIGDTLHDTAVDTINATNHAAAVVVAATQDAALDVRDVVLDLADYLGFNYGPLKAQRRARRNWKKAKALSVFAVAAERQRQRRRPARSPTVSSVTSERASTRASSEDFLSRQGADRLSPRLHTMVEELGQQALPPQVMDAVLREQVQPPAPSPPEEQRDPPEERRGCGCFPVKRAARPP